MKEKKKKTGLQKAINIVVWVMLIFTVLSVVLAAVGGLLSY
ncbi:DUF4044 domain-containing protein [Ligilactobacillus sp. WILCCON 0076]|uniref:DUF4044 domain-containing protein n=1 Tax=Ligilactobacillus ubinensis TaxID=2876789 RepID=A0A9X2FKN6_9LACO|nr:DUF4044 domain-containing protein [Ligilactobacillus ubinensis]MCP0886506.1 DUF4044 domain-containing protein [Ligilactobacillus ubinensis]